MFEFFEEYKSAQKLVTKHYPVIFYAESASYYQYFEHLLQQLINANISVCYITSDNKDPVLKTSVPQITPVYIRVTLAFVFPKLKAGVVVMTMPDLNRFHLKRSDQVKKYAYVFHAMVSTHQQYRKHAFDHYDAIFCVGNHHKREIRESEKLYGLPPKELIDYGYPLISQLEKVQQETMGQKVVIAPTWYPEGLLTTCLQPLLDALNGMDLQIVLRPHPEFAKRYKKAFRKLTSLINISNNIELDNHADVFHHLADAAVLITDRSGIAFEYFLATKQNVLFIDTPPKILNKDLTRYDSVPVEDEFRSVMGLRLSPNEIHLVRDYLTQLMETGAGEKNMELIRNLKFDDQFQNNGLAYIVKNIS